MAQKFTNEQIIAAYNQTGSVWRAAKQLGLCGQSVWERLKRLGHPLSFSPWSEDELAELCALAPACTIGEIARRLARSYGSVATKISELGIGVRFGNRIRTKRGTGLTKSVVARYLKDLNNWGGSAQQFCRQRGLDIEQV